MAALSLSIAPPAIAQAEVPPPNLPSIAQRYAAAEHYLRAGRLVTDADVQAHFTSDGTGVMFHIGPANHGAVRILDLSSVRISTIITDEDLAALLKREPDGGADVYPSGFDFDTKSRTLTFDWNGRRSLAGGIVSKAEQAPKQDDPGLSPDGRTRIVARGFDLVAVDVRSGREIALTTGGTIDQPYGRGIAPLATILAQGTETPTMPVSARWSPDSRYILSWRLDTRNVPHLSMTQQNPPDSLYPRSFSYIYPTAGAPVLPKADRILVDVAAAMRAGRATIVQVRMPTEELLYPADPDIEWIDGHAQAQWTERGYGKLEIYSIDPASGATKVVARESVNPLVTVTSTMLQPAPELGGTLDISERSGWAQLYLVSPSNPDGGTALTKGNWEVLSIDRVDPAKRSIFVTGVGREPDRNPYWRALYRVGLDGAQPTLLTPEPLDHDTHISDDGRYAIDAMSTPTVPTRTVVRDLTDGHIVAELARANPDALLASGFTMPEQFHGVAADGHTPLYGMIYRPAHFDPNRHYPVIDYVYTGPTTTQVPISWTETIRSTASSVAQLGAIVVMIDGTGTSRRGQAFRLPAYQNLGEVGLDDHIAMIRQMAAHYPYMDVDRAGVYGCSAGGYDAARFILRRPSFFKVSVASSGNHDERLDKAWWPEVTMGDPDPAVWERNSNMPVAGRLQGKLMLVHGDVDDNVPVTETFRLEKALIDANRNVDVVILPNQSHCASTPYFWRKFRDYFTRNLLDEAPPAGAEIESATAAPTK